MNDHLARVAVCAECHGMAEPPLTYALDPHGEPTVTVVCQDCREQILRRDEYELGGEG